jgi:hypothetical protein
MKARAHAPSLLLLAAAFLLAPTTGRAVGGEIGNGRVEPPNRNGDPMAPAEGAKELVNPAWVEVPSTVVPEGKLFEVIAWYETHGVEEPSGTWSGDCRATFGSDALQHSRVVVDQCRAERVSAGKYKLTLRHRFEAPTLSRAYRVASIDWRVQEEWGRGYSATSFNDHLILVEGSVAWTRSPLALLFSGGDHCRGSEIRVGLKLTGGQAIIAAALELEVDQGVGSLDSGFFPILPGGLGGDWVLGSSETPHAGWSTFVAGLQVPANFSDVRWLSVTRLILLDRELRETAVATGGKLSTWISDCQ